MVSIQISKNETVDVTVFASDFYTNKSDFLLGGGTTSEDYLAAGDSGGAVSDTANQLIGLNEAIGTYDHQPGDLALFGDQSFMTDLATYREPDRFRRRPRAGYGRLAGYYDSASAATPIAGER